MEKEAKLTSGQTATFVYGGAAGNIVYTFTWVTYMTGRPFWVATLIGVLLNIPFVVWLLFIGSYKPDSTIFGILEDGLGKAVSKITILFYLAINIAASVCMLNMFTGTVNVYFLQFTPPYIIMFVVVALCALFVFSGFRVFAVLIEILVVFMMANYFLGFGLSFVNLFKVENVTPVFDTTYIKFLKGTLFTAGSSAECLLVLMVTAGRTPQNQKQYASAAKGLVIWSFLLSFAIFIMEGNIGQEMLARVAQAGITVSRIIQIGEFVRGLEIPILITYQFFAFEKTILFLYTSCAAARELFRIKNGRVLIIPVAAIILVSSAYVNSFNAAYFLAVFLGSYVILPFSVLVLLLASLSAAIIKKRGGTSSK